MGFGDIWTTPESTNFSVTKTSQTFIEKDSKIVFVRLQNVSAGYVYIAQGQDAVVGQGLVLPSGGFIQLGVDGPMWKWVGDTLNMITTNPSKTVAAYIVRRP